MVPEGAAGCWNMPERTRVGAGRHISVGKRSRGGKLLPPGHEKVPEGALVGRGRERRARKKAASAGECCLMLGRGGDYSHSIVALGFGDIS